MSVGYEVVRSRVQPGAEAAERAAASLSEIPEAAAMMELIDEIVSFEHGVGREPEAGE